MHTKRSGEPDVFSENKANLLNTQMNVNKVLTKGYENKRLRRASKTNPIKAKTNPIQTQFIPTEGGPKPKQSQSNPTCPERSRRVCSELACPERGRGVEPISKPAQNMSSAILNHNWYHRSVLGTPYGEER
jgi:hypothetical protein